MLKIIDLHCDTVGQLQAGYDLTGDVPTGHVTLDRLQRGGVGTQVFACFVSSEVPQTDAFRRAAEMIENIHTYCGDKSKHFILTDKPSELDRQETDQKINILIAVENGHALGSNLKNLERLKDKKVCYITLTHSKHLSWAASSGESLAPRKGLNKFGKKVINAMNELGIIVDISHVHESTFWDVMKTTKRPVIASHSNTRAICNTARNLSNDQIKAIARNGGMIGINFFPGFLDPTYAAGLKTHCSDLFAELDRIENTYMEDPAGKNRALHMFAQELQKRMQKYSVYPDRIIDHICHITNLVGTDHIGFGSDFDGVPALPAGIYGSDIYPALLESMRVRNFSNEDIEKIAAGNFIRVMRENFSN